MNGSATPHLLDRLLKLALLLCCGMALSKGLADPDFWGHVQYGRDVLREGLPREATYTYTAEGHRWINHENLAELALAVGVDHLGPAWLLVLKCLAGMAALGVILRQAERQGVGQLAAYTGAMLVAANMMLFWTLRPQLFSFVYFVLLMLLLEWAFADWTPQRPATGRTGLRLLLAAPLFAVWANTHGGFLAGLCVMTALLALRAVEARHTATWRTSAVLAGIVAAASLATLLNPYGVELHLWLLQSLGEPRPEIVEWRPPELSIPWIPFWTLAVAIVLSASVTRRRRDWVQLTIVWLVLWQSLEHRRHVVFLSLLFGFWMLPHWDSLLNRLGVGRDQRSIGESITGATRWLFGGGLAAACMLLGVCLYGQVQCIPVRHDSYPVDAFQFIANRQLSGRLLTRLRWGQYAIAAFGDRGEPRASLQVAFDGRFRTCYPQEVVDQYFDFADGELSPLRNRGERSQPPDGQRILQAHPGPDLVLVDRSQPHPVRVMREQSAQWTVLYEDPLCQLWGRRDQCDDPQSANFVPPAARQSHATLLGDITPWPALPRRDTRPGQLAGLSDVPSIP